MGSPTAPPRSTSAGRPDRIGRYRIVGELGRGGMGVVYRAEDERLGRPVALKVLPAHLGADATARERLAVEARAAAALDHPNVCTVYEVGDADDGRPYIAFACYDGQTLRDRLRAGPLPAPEAVRIAREVAAGVAAAHAAGIVHRDLKPSNVFLCEDGTAKVLDFGIARVRDTVLTATGQTPGTVEYGAPETAHGRGDARSDVWSLGVVLYEMLTGRRPFAGTYPAAVLYAVLHETPPPPSALREDVPEAVDAVVMRCLAKEPDERFQDARAVAAALAGPGEETEVAPFAAVRQAIRVVGRRVRRSRAWQAGAAALVMLVAAGGWQVIQMFGSPELIHLAVLPPVLGDTEEDRAFAEGVAEVVSSGLSERSNREREIATVPVSVLIADGVRSATEAHRQYLVEYALSGSRLQRGDEQYLVWTLVRLGDGPPEEVESVRVPMQEGEGASIQERALDAVAEMLGLGPAEGSGIPEVDGDPYFVQGLGFLQNDQQLSDLSRAVTLFEQSVEANPQFARGYARLAQALALFYGVTRDSTLTGRAVRAADRALALDPDDPVALVARSTLYRLRGDGEDAAREALRAKEVAPTSPEVLVALARAQETSGDVREAEQTFREAIRSGPEEWVGRAELGDFYSRQGEYAASAAEYREVVRLVPASHRGYLGLGSALQYQGDVEGAIAVYDRALDIGPEPQILSNLGTIRLVEGNPRVAAGLYQQSLSLDSTDHQVWSNLASALSQIPGEDTAQTNAFRSAAAAARRLLAVNPRFARAHSGLGIYLEALGDRRAALWHARRAASTANGDPLVHFQSSYALELLGQRQEAIDQLAKAIQRGFPTGNLGSYEEIASLLRDARIIGLLNTSPT